jgi:ERCC4-type nuclease
MLREMGITSTVPEQYGADYLYYTEHWGLVGVQRKELKDLVASHMDDRVGREVIAMRELDVGVWLLEGSPQWTGSGDAMWTRTKYTRSRHLGFLFALTFQGFIIYNTETITESMELLVGLEKWLKKDRHKGISGRASARGVFGEADEREWGIHFLSGLPGVGLDRAEKIWEHFQGMPFAVTGKLQEVPGIGKKTAERIERVFG